MNAKLTKEEEQYIKLLLQSKPTDDKNLKNKQWLDNHVKALLSKYKKSSKLF